MQTIFKIKKANIIKFILVALLFLVAIFSINADATITYADAKEISEQERLEQLRHTEIEEIAALCEYDGRDYGIVTPVKDQGKSNLCWAYASISASETSILRSGIKEYTKNNLSLSPQALAYSRWYRPVDPLGNTQKVIEAEGANWYYSSGGASYCAALMSQWAGPIDISNSETANPYENASFHLNNAVQIKSKDISEIKLAIAKYGAVTFSYNNVREAYYYNPTQESGSASYPHACTLIGWDDNIAASKFEPSGAKQNGGWLVKNSYNSLPYFHLSYDATSESIFAFDFTAKESYDNNYFYDYNLTDHANYLLNIKKACQVYEAKKGADDKTEYLKAVNVGLLGKNISVKVDIYVDMQDETNPESGTKVGSGEAFFDYGGFRTVNLVSPVALENNKKFACVVSVQNEDDSAYISNMTGKVNALAYVYKDYWQSTYNYTPRIKAFTSLESSGQVEKTQVTVTVENGLIEGTNESAITVDINESVTVIAKEMEGKRFKGWSADGGNTILSNLSVFTFTAIQNITLTAVFEDESSVITPDDSSASPNDINAGMIAGITIGVICFLLICIYFSSYLAIYRKGVVLKNKFLIYLFSPMNTIFKKRK